MKLSIIYPVLTVGFLLLLFVSFSCVPESIVTIKESHNPELNNKCLISGYVLDKDTKDELIGASILLNDGEYETRSNEKGFFTFKNLSPGIYEITIKYVGYKIVSKSNFRVRGNYVYELNIELASDLNFPPI